MTLNRKTAFCIFILFMHVACNWGIKKKNCFSLFIFLCSFLFVSSLLNFVEYYQRFFFFCSIETIYVVGFEVMYFKWVFMVGFEDVRKIYNLNFLGVFQTFRQLGQLILTLELLCELLYLCN